MNDLDFHVVARNVIFLLLALTLPSTSGDKEDTLSPETAEALIYVWYSASIPSSVMAMLQDRVKPLIVDVCSKIASRTSDSLLGKTWAFSNRRNLRLVLKKKY